MTPAEVEETAMRLVSQLWDLLGHLERMLDEEGDE